MSEREQDRRVDLRRFYRAKYPNVPSSLVMQFAEEALQDERQALRTQYERTKAHCPECGGDLFGDENAQECIECDWQEASDE